MLRARLSGKVRASPSFLSSLSSDSIITIRSSVVNFYIPFLRVPILFISIIHTCFGTKCRAKPSHFGVTAYSAKSSFLSSSQAEAHWLTRLLLKQRSRIRVCTKDVLSHISGNAMMTPKT